MKVNIYTIVLTLCWWSAASQVQEQLSPTEMKQVSIVTEPLTTFKGFFRGGIATNYSVVDKIFLENGSKESLSGNIWGSSWTFYAFMQYGITDRLMVELFIPYKIESIKQSFSALDMTTGEELVFKWDSPSNGLSDLDVTVAYQLITETAARPALGLFVIGTMPTGKKNPSDADPSNPNNYDRPTGSGAFAVNTILKLRKVVYPFSYTISASYKLKMEGEKMLEPSTPEVSFKDGDVLNFTGIFNLHLNDWIVFKNIADYYSFAEGEVDGVKSGGSSWLLNYTAGLSFQLKRLRLDQGISFPIIGKLSAADPSYVLVMQYTF
jgi:hypothetical protein